MICWVVMLMKLTEILNSDKLSISFGYVSSDEDCEMTIDDMRRESEKRMYKNKRDFYAKEGKDRRKKEKD